MSEPLMIASMLRANPRGAFQLQLPPAPSGTIIQAFAEVDRRRRTVDALMA